MVYSRSFGLFILVLCLVSCVCAHAVVSSNEATKVARAVKQSAKKVLSDAKAEVRDTLHLLRDVNTCKRNAEEAAEEAEKAAKGNIQAEAIAQKARKASDEVVQLYGKASKLTKKYLDDIKKLRTKAEELEKNADNDLYISSRGDVNYTKINEDADTIKAQVEALNKELQDAMRSLEDVSKAHNAMLKPEAEAHLAKYHVDVIVAVAKFETLLKSADDGIKFTEQKRDEINAIVQEMKKLYDNSPKDLIHYISHLQNIVEDGLRSASYRIEEAKKAKTRMLERKAQADEALVKVEAEKNVENAKKVAGIAMWANKDAEGKVEEIKKARESAMISASDAQRWKSDAVSELNKKTKKPDATQDKSKMNPSDAENTHQPIKDTTESSVVIGKKQPTITNPDQSMTEQPVRDTTESPTVIGKKQLTITNPDQSMTEQTVRDTTESPTVIGKKQLTITNPDQSMTEQPVRDTTESSVVIGKKQPTITNPDQSMTEQPVRDTTESPTVIGKKQPTITNPDKAGSGGTEFTQPSSSDSAMTVSVPLLLTLIACAALY